MKKYCCISIILVSLLLIGCGREAESSIRFSSTPYSITNYNETIFAVEQINSESDFGPVFLLSESNADIAMSDELVSPSEGLFIAAYYYPLSDTENHRITSIVFESSDYNLFGFTVGEKLQLAEEILISAGYNEPGENDFMYNTNNIENIVIYRKHDITITLYYDYTNITAVAIVVLDPAAFAMN